ncbi:MAG: HD domain-containing protein [Bacilli bacterium]|nr:HD domain-containing protein [Bacilli bacterium]
MDYLEEVKNNFLNKERNLSKYATLSEESQRYYEEDEDDIRPNFYHDIDRIIYSLSFIRYQNKTQVFAYQNNDHISHRMIHVQFVSKIARTIGRALNLNEDLIEAIALGHDIGHTPLGHVGERILNDISKRELGEYFAHNVQSVRDLMCVEKNGQGLNLSLQVLDGVLTHNGEILKNIYKPQPKTKEEFLDIYNNAYKDLKKSKSYSAMTLEGCVVRISDIIAYVGRDVEDAIRVGLIKKEDIPKEITSVLGTTNSKIINKIIMDIIENSIDKPYIKLSPKVFNALLSLKKFNMENIYKKSMSTADYKKYEKGMNDLFNKYLNDINDKNSLINKIFLSKQSSNYLENTSDKRKVIDFISGMTDNLFLSEVNNLPKS